MPSVIKQRLLGALVILIIVVIAAPWVWHLSDTKQPPHTISIQWPSGMQQAVVSADAQPNVTASVESTNPKQDMTESVINQMPDQKVVSIDQRDSSHFSLHKQQSSSPVPQAAHWDIQIASFRQRDNAVRLVNDLKQQGYASFMRPKIASSENPLTKVFIGPLATKSQVDQMLTALLQTNGLRGIAIYQKQGDS